MQSDDHRSLLIQLGREAVDRLAQGGRLDATLLQLRLQLADLLLVLFQGLADQLHVLLDLLSAALVQLTTSLLLDGQVVFRIPNGLEIRFNIVECREHLVQLLRVLRVFDSQRVILCLQSFVLCRRLAARGQQRCAYAYYQYILHFLFVFS